MNKPTNDLIKVSATPIISEPVRFGLIVLGVFFGTFLLWSVLAPIETAAIAVGKVTVDSNRKTIQHLEGGIVRKIHVREGTIVKKGALLVELEDTQARAALDLLQGQSFELQATEARLKAEIAEQDTLEFPAHLTANHAEKIKKILTAQSKLFDANKKAMAGQLVILKQRIEQLQKEIESLDAQVVSESKQLKLIEEEIEAVKYLESKKLIERPRLLALQREAARLIGNRGEHIGLIAKAQQKIGETNSQIITVQDQNKKDKLTELRETQKQLADVLEREKGAKDVLERTKITAPTAGRVVGLLEHTIGGVLKPGADIMNIIPSDDRLVIEAKLSPLDIDIVHEGLSAKVQLTAYKTRNTPTLLGEVSHVSADSFEDKNTQEAYYLARVEIPQSQLALVEHVKLHPGMPAQVMIIIDKRSPFAYFMSPIKDSFNRAFREQ